MVFWRCHCWYICLTFIRWSSMMTCCWHSDDHLLMWWVPMVYLVFVMIPWYCWVMGAVLFACRLLPLCRALLCRLMATMPTVVCRGDGGGIVVLTLKHCNILAPPLPFSLPSIDWRCLFPVLYCGLFMFSMPVTTPLRAVLAWRRYRAPAPVHPMLPLFCTWRNFTPPAAITGILLRAATIIMMPVRVTFYWLARTFCCRCPLLCLCYLLQRHLPARTTIPLPAWYLDIMTYMTIIDDVWKIRQPCKHLCTTVLCSVHVMPLTLLFCLVFYNLYCACVSN